MSIPPPPPPPPTNLPIHQTPKPPPLPPTPPKGAYLLELLIYNGAPFKDHWAYWVCSHRNPNLGVELQVHGSVLTGFRYEVRRSHDLTSDSAVGTATGLPALRIPLQWVAGEFVDEGAMFNGGVAVVGDRPVCAFERSAFRVQPPGKTLRSVGVGVGEGTPVGNIRQRDCQTWVVEAADELVKDHILREDVAAYLHAIKQ